MSLVSSRTRARWWARGHQLRAPVPQKTTRNEKRKISRNPFLSRVLSYSKLGRSGDLRGPELSLQSVCLGREYRTCTDGLSTGWQATAVIHSLATAGIAKRYQSRRPKTNQDQAPAKVRLSEC